MIASYQGKILRVNGKPAEISDKWITGLQAFWKFDDNLLDSQGSMYLDQQHGSYYIPGKINNATFFTGEHYLLNSNSCTRMPPPQSFVDIFNNKNPFTFNFWYSPSDGYNATRFLIDFSDLGGPSPYTNWVKIYFDISSSSNVSFTRGIASGGSGSINATIPPMIDASWYNFNIEYDGLGGSIYVNNTLCSSIWIGTNASLGTMVSQFPYTRFIIGGINVLGYCTLGTIDQFRTYNKALSPQEIGILWNSGKGC
jgi:hypothetical protein